MKRNFNLMYEKNNEDHTLAHEVCHTLNYISYGLNFSLASGSKLI